VPSNATREPLNVDYQGWSNYKSAEDLPGVVTERLEAMIKAGWVRSHDSLESLAKSVGGDPVATRLGIVSKVKPNGKIKHRLIWDLLESNANSWAEPSERILLPTVLDATNDILDLAEQAQEGESIDMLVLDVSDAFHIVPLHPLERKYVCTQHEGKYQEYLCLVFGPKTGPTTWGRIAAFIGRSSQAVIGSQKGRVNIFVDDPLVSFVGSKLQRDQSALMLVWWWAVIGLPLAWDKGVRGHTVPWIGAMIHTSSDQVSFEPQEGKVEDCRALVKLAMDRPTLSRKALSRLTGKLGFLAGLQPLIYPFLAPMWAVLYSPPIASLPDHVIHTCRMTQECRWMLALTTKRSNYLHRSFHYRSLQPHTVVRIAVDASPWGFGAVAYNAEWKPLAFLFDQISLEDEKLLGIMVGVSDFMPITEALCFLIAVRMWAKPEAGLMTRTDSATTVDVLFKMRSADAQLNRIAAEMALDLLANRYSPMVISHIPGVTNILPDKLSRAFQPGVAFMIPCELEHAHKVAAPLRDANFWLTLVQTTSNHMYLVS
jgi:hypothetical protein